ncbi:MAG: rhodanese-like domain-containing protein [Ignavibacteriales bacterium]|nr:rhodanese-like domain-containing protein [Ignavibacteriales bacterium]
MSKSRQLSEDSRVQAGWKRRSDRKESGVSHEKDYAELDTESENGRNHRLLGFFALFAGNPYSGSTATLNTSELAVLVQREVDHVTPEELADWIIQGKSDFRLLDLRSAEEYAEYHLPGAEQVTMGELDRYPIQRNEKIILYSDGGIHSAQAWFLLNARKFRGVYILSGGMEEWKDRVLFPTPDGNGNADFEKMKEVSKFFGGAPRSGGEERFAPRMTMPELEMPSPVVVPGGTKKKKKEGC